MARPTESRSSREMAEYHRSRIKTGSLITRLRKFAEGEIDMTRDRLKAHEILLRKTLPDLSAADLTTKGDSISFNFTVKKK